MHSLVHSTAGGEAGGYRRGRRGRQRWRAGQDQPQLCGGRHMSTGRRPTGPASRPAQSDGRPARLHLSPDLRLKRPRIGDAAGGLGPREWHRSRAGHQVGG
eukprot:scaffold114096_cov48-Phaeocystis_antarctica.AAC.2